MSVQRLTFQEAELPHLKQCGSADEAMAYKEKLRLSHEAMGCGFLPFTWGKGVKRFRSHEEANADWDKMIENRVRILNEQRKK